MDRYAVESIRIEWIDAETPEAAIEEMQGWGIEPTAIYDSHGRKVWSWEDED